MQKTTEVMQSMGKNMTPQEMQKTMQQFAMENQKMDMSSEMIDDAISDALDSDETEGEADDVVSQVLVRSQSHCCPAHCGASSHASSLLSPLATATFFLGRTYYWTSAVALVALHCTAHLLWKAISHDALSKSSHNSTPNRFVH